MVAIDTTTFTTTDPWFVGLVGLPIELTVDNDTVDTGFTHADGVYGWALPNRDT